MERTLPADTTSVEKEAIARSAEGKPSDGGDSEIISYRMGAEAKPSRGADMTRVLCILRPICYTPEVKPYP